MRNIKLNNKGRFILTVVLPLAFMFAVGVYGIVYSVIHVDWSDYSVIPEEPVAAEPLEVEVSVDASALEAEVDRLEDVVRRLEERLDAIEANRGAEVEREAVTPRGEGMSVKLTAYDLSVASCAKLPSHPEYGITASGKRVQERHTVAVDPKVIPLGTRLYLQFPEPYADMSGEYTAEDTGSGVKGKHIDVYLGESVTDECMQFGVRQGVVWVLE